jgi:hypothetical protein
MKIERFKCDSCGDVAIMHWDGKHSCCERLKCLNNMVALLTLLGQNTWEDHAESMRLTHIRQYGAAPDEQ